MMLLPPRSTLFPYTTLFRSIVQLIGELQGAPRRLVREALQRQGSEEDGLAGMVDRLIKYQLSGIFRSQNRDLLLENGRSEEHTSELQSLRHLVCRLLLEKKK